MSSRARQRSQRSPRVAIPVPPAVQLLAAMAIGVFALILTTAWIISLERDLPGVRSPRDPGSSTVLPGHAAMMPGVIDIRSADVELTGDWIVQEIGESDWIASDVEGSRLRGAFYGTDLYLSARVGPDASRAYIRINGEPIPGMAQDEFGSFVGLWAGQASDQPILVASNLAHGEHIVEIVAGGDGELAVAGFEIQSATPIPWAFVLAYSGVAIGIFLLVRSMLLIVNQQSSAVIRNRPRERPPVREPGQE